MNRRPSTRPLVVLVLALALLEYVNECLLRPLAGQHDFAIHLEIARLAIAGVDVYHLEPATAAALSQRVGVAIPTEVNYPPSYLAFLAPLVALPAAWAHALWLLLQNAALAASMLLLARLTGLAREGGVALALLMCLVATAEPVAQSFLYGQVNPTLLLLMSLGLADLERRRDARAGFWLALAAALKVTPAVLLMVPLGRRRWRVGLGVAVAVALVLPALAAVFDQPVDVVRDYLSQQSGRGVAGAGRDSALNQSAAAFVARLAWVAPSLAAAPRWPSVAGALTTVLAAGCLLAGVGLAANRATPLAQVYGLVVACVLIASPVSWEHHRLLLLLPAVVVAARFFQGPVPGRAAALLLVGWILVAADLPYDHPVARSGPLALLASLKLYGTAAFAVGLGLLAWSDRRSPHRAGC